LQEQVGGSIALQQELAALDDKVKGIEKDICALRENLLISNMMGKVCR
jgi:hypothetical protein